MGSRFRRTANVGFGVRAYVSKSGPGVSWGIPGFRIGMNAKGQRTLQLGLPGSGLGWRKTWSGRKQRAPGFNAFAAHLFAKIGWGAHKHFAKGMLALANDQPDAQKHFEAARHRNHASPQFYAAWCAARKDTEAAIELLRDVINSGRELPDQMLLRISPQATVPLHLSDEIEREVPVDRTAPPLFLAALLKAEDRNDEAIRILEFYKGDPNVTLSLADAYCRTARYEETMMITRKITNSNDVTANTLTYRAKALWETGAGGPALATLREALSSKSRSDQVRCAARYLRGSIFASLGDVKSARKDYSEVAALNESYRDVKERLASLPDERPARRAPSVETVETPAEGAATPTGSATPGVDPIRTARVRAGLSRVELSLRSGISTRTIYMIESGAQKPRPETLRKLLAACTIACLLFGLGACTTTPPKSAMRVTLDIDEDGRAEQAVATTHDVVVMHRERNRWVAAFHTTVQGMVTAIHARGNQVEVDARWQVGSVIDTPYTFRIGADPYVPRDFAIVSDDRPTAGIVAAYDDTNSLTILGPVPGWFAEGVVPAGAQLTAGMAGMLASAPIGLHVDVPVRRNGQPRTIPIVILPRLSSAEAPFEPPSLGWYLKTTKDGVTITGVTTDGPARKAGLNAGDKILSIDDVAVHAARDLVAVLQYAADDSDTVTLQVQSKDRKSKAIVVTLETRYFNQDTIGVTVL